jgi:hypothetical protein
MDHAVFSVAPLNGVSKGGSFPLCDILIGAGVNVRPRRGFVYNYVNLWIAEPRGGDKRKNSDGKRNYSAEVDNRADKMDVDTEKRA